MGSRCGIVAREEVTVTREVGSRWFWGAPFDLCGIERGGEEGAELRIRGGRNAAEVVRQKLRTVTVRVDEFLPRSAAPMPANAKGECRRKNSRRTARFAGHEFLSVDEDGGKAGRPGLRPR